MGEEEKREEKRGEEAKDTRKRYTVSNHEKDRIQSYAEWACIYYKRSFVISFCFVMNSHLQALQN